MVRACREGKHGLRGAGWGAVGHSDGIRWSGVEDPPARATCDDLRRGIAGVANVTTRHPKPLGPPLTRSS